MAQSHVSANDGINYKHVIACAFGFLLLAGFAWEARAEEPKRILKWKDDKGVTQYGDKIPPQYSNRENSEINKQGIVVKQNKPYTYQDEAANQAKAEQQKKDRALLNAFSNANEIDLARDRNLQLDQVTLDGLQLQRSNSQKRLADQQKYINGLKKQNKPVPTDETAELKTMQYDLNSLDQQIAERKAIMEDTRKRFEEDKRRYIELSGGTTTPSSAPATYGTTGAPASPATVTSVNKR